MNTNRGVLTLEEPKKSWWNKCKSQTITVFEIKKALSDFNKDFQKCPIRKHQTPTIPS